MTTTTNLYSFIEANQLQPTLNQVAQALGDQVEFLDERTTPTPTVAGKEWMVITMQDISKTVKALLRPILLHSKEQIVVDKFFQEKPLRALKPKDQMRLQQLQNFSNQILNAPISRL